MATDPKHHTAVKTLSFHFCVAHLADHFRVESLPSKFHGGQIGTASPAVRLLAQEDAVLAPWPSSATSLSYLACGLGQPGAMAVFLKTELGRSYTKEGTEAWENFLAKDALTSTEPANRGPRPVCFTADLSPERTEPPIMALSSEIRNHLHNWLTMGYISFNIS